MAVLAAIGVVAAVAAAIGGDDANPDGARAEADDGDVERSPAPTPSPDSGPLAAPTPPGPPPVLLAEAPRPNRAEFVAAVEHYLASWRVGDATAVRQATWPGCEATGAAIVAEVGARLGDGARLPVVDRALVVSSNLAVADLGDGEATRRAVFVRDGDAWRSGWCPDPDGELAAQMELPTALDDLAVLAGLDYRGAELAAQSFGRADLAFALFNDADLSGSNLAGADLEGADLRDATLAQVWAPQVTTAPAGADFGGVQAPDIVFATADLTGSRFDGALLDGADFGGVTLAGVTFRDADLSGAFFDETSAAEVADWTGATCPDGEPADGVRGCLDHLR